MVLQTDRIRRLVNDAGILPGYSGIPAEKIYANILDVMSSNDAGRIVRLTSDMSTHMPGYSGRSSQEIVDNLKDVFTLKGPVVGVPDYTPEETIPYRAGTTFQSDFIAPANQERVTAISPPDVTAPQPLPDKIPLDFTNYGEDSRETFHPKFHDVTTPEGRAASIREEDSFDAFMQSLSRAMSYDQDKEGAAIRAQTHPVASTLGAGIGMVGSAFVPGMGLSKIAKVPAVAGAIAKYGKAGKPTFDALTRMATVAGDYGVRYRKELTSDDENVRNEALKGLAVSVAAAGSSVAPELLKRGWWQPILQGLTGGATNVAAQAVTGVNPLTPEAATNTVFQALLAGAFGFNMARGVPKGAREQTGAGKQAQEQEIGVKNQLQQEGAQNAPEMQGQGRQEGQGSGQVGFLPTEEEFLRMTPEEQAAYYREARKRSYTDKLTGIGNRTAMADDATLEKIDLKTAKTLMTDLDKFKLVNDTYGHDIGDKALVVYANVLRKHFDDIGKVYRVGGEEIATIFKQNVPDEVILEREAAAKNELANTRIDVGAGKFVEGLTFSSGLGKGLENSDKQLYNVKGKGKEGEPGYIPGLGRAGISFEGGYHEYTGTRPASGLWHEKQLSVRGRTENETGGTPRREQPQEGASNEPAPTPEQRASLSSKNPSNDVDDTNTYLFEKGIDPSELTDPKNTPEQILEQIPDAPQNVKDALLRDRQLNEHALNADALERQSQEANAKAGALERLRGALGKRKFTPEAVRRVFPTLKDSSLSYVSKNGLTADEFRRDVAASNRDDFKAIGIDLDEINPDNFLKMVIDGEFNQSAIDKLRAESKSLDLAAQDEVRKYDALNAGAEEYQGTAAAASIGKFTPRMGAKPEQPDLFAGTESADTRSETRKAIDRMMQEREATRKAKQRENPLEGTPLFDKNEQEAMATEQTNMFGSESNAAVGNFSERGLPEKPSGEGAPEAKPTPEGEGERLTVTDQTPDTRKVFAHELPEVIELFNGISSGRWPKIVKSIRAAMGAARGVMTSNGIKIVRDLAKDPEQFIKTLSHEIGHWIDHLPEKFMGRGNVLGHMASLSKFMRRYLVGPKGEMFFNPTLRRQMIDFSKKWREDFNEGDKTPYVKYRLRPTELYADAVSGLMVDPDFLRSEAPEFWKAFETFMDRKPEVKQAWDAIQSRYAGGRQSVVENRLQRTFKGYEQKEQEHRKVAEERDAESKKKRPGIVTSVYRGLLEKYGLIEKAVNVAKKQGLVIADNLNPYFHARRQKYVSGRQQVYLNKAKTAEEKAKISDDDSWNDKEARDYIGAVMQYQQQSARHLDKAAPLGISGDAATEMLAHIRQKLGNEKANKIDEAVNEFFKVRGEEVVPYLTEGPYADTFSKEMLETIKGNRTYSRRSVVTDFEEKYGKQAAGSLLNLHSVQGTLRAIGNPFVETIVYDVGLIRAKSRSDFVRSAIDFFETHKENESIVGSVKIEPAERTGNTFKHVDGDLQTVYFLKDGKLQARNVSKELAELFESNPDNPDGVLRALRAIGDVQRQVFVKYSLPFLLRNPVRDIKGSMMNIPEYGINPLPALRYTFKALPEVWKYIRTGKMSPDIEQAFREGAIPVHRNFETEAKLQGKDELNRVSSTFESKEEAHNGFVRRSLGKIDGVFEVINQLEEKTRKLADFKFLKEEHPEISPELRAQKIRSQSGTSDTFAGGNYKKVTNQLWIFSNANFQGQRAAIESFLQNKTRYALKFALYDVMPKAFMAAVEIGGIKWLTEKLGFGEKEAKWLDDAYKSIPNQDKSRYTCIPLPMRYEDGRQAYIRIPSDYTGQALGSILWDAMNVTKPKGTQTLASNVAALSPIGSAGMQPVVELATGWAEYLMHGNIYDAWSGRMVLPDDVEGSGFKHEVGPLAKWSYDQVGGSIVWKIPNDFDLRGKGVLEKMLGIPVDGPALGAFIKVSDRGTNEELKDIKAKVRQEEKGKSLDIKNQIIKSLKDIDTAKTSTSDFRARARALWKQARDNGYKPSYGEFWRRYRDIAMKKMSSAELREVITATSLREREAVVEKILDNRKLSGDERAKEKIQLMIKVRQFKIFMEGLK